MQYLFVVHLLEPNFLGGSIFISANQVTIYISMVIYAKLFLGKENRACIVKIGS